MSNHHQNTFERVVVQDIGRRNSHDTYALPGEPGVPPRVMRNLDRKIMMRAVDLDGQSCRRAVEVEDVGAYRVLSPESQAGHAMLPEAIPQQDFRQAQLLPELASP